MHTDRNQRLDSIWVTTHGVFPDLKLISFPGCRKRLSPAAKKASCSQNCQPNLVEIGQKQAKTGWGGEITATHEVLQV